MPDTRPSSVLVYLDALRRHWALSLFSSSMVLALVVPFAMGLPDIYRASATILVEGQLFDTLGPGSAEIDSRLQAIKQEALSRARLTELIEQFNLYAESRKEASIADALGRTQRDIQIEITSTSQRSGQANTIAFKLSYVGSDPTTVASVTNALASFYVAQNDKLRSRVVAYKTERLEDSLADAKKKLDSQERRLAVFRNQNMGALPQQFDANQAALTRISVEIQGNTGEQIRQRERRQTLLNQIFDVTHTGADESDLQLQLAKRTKELADLRLNETADNPNVRAKEREIDALTSQIANKGASPAAVNNGQSRLGVLRSELADTDAQLQKLAKDYETLRNSMNTYQARIESAPVHNTEFEAILSDYRSARDLYDSVQKRHDEAQMAERAEQSHGAEQFRILDPAFPPSSPAGPNRFQLLAFGLLLAAIVGMGLAVIVDRFDTSFHTIYELRAFTHVPILASIPLIVTGRDKAKRALLVCAMAGGASVFLALVGTRAFLYGQGSVGITRTLLRLG